VLVIKAMKLPLLIIWGAVKEKMKKAPGKGGFLAERVGFEPTVRLHAQQIYSLPP
jgi:hypothetical protein